MFDKFHQKESEPLLPKHARVHADVLNRVAAHTRRHGHGHEKYHWESKMRQVHSEVLNNVKNTNHGAMSDIQIPRSGTSNFSTPSGSIQPESTPQHQSHAPKPHPAPVSKGLRIPKISPSVPHPPAHVTTGGQQLVHQPVWIPDTGSPVERNRSRTLVLCFDASSDQLDVGDSNIIQFLSFLKKGDKETQVVYYQTGSVSSTMSGSIDTVKNQISKTVDSMLAPNLASDVQDGYRFLVQNYMTGDRISIFGYSRGAYIARALAGMLQRVGLVPADNIQQIPFAWGLYLRDDDNAEQDRDHYKRTFSTNVIVDFVGVWETVLTVGIVDKELPFAQGNNSIRVFRHALALDEHRANFMPNFYHYGGQSFNLKMKESFSSVECDSRLGERVSPTNDPEPDSIASSSSHEKVIVYPTKDPNARTDVCEVWFAGCHGDVGGGYVKNGAAHSLARIPLRWMIRECFRMRTGIIFDARMLQEELGLDWTTIYPEVRPRPVRIPALPGSIIEEMQPQGWGIVSFVAFLLTLIIIPVRIVLTIVLWPVTSIWLLIKFTTIVKYVRKQFLKWLHMYSGIDWVISKFKIIGAWFDRQLFPIASQVPGRCQRPCHSEEDHEHWDALSPMHDRLKIRRFWSIMEVLPLRFIRQKKRRDEYYRAFNCGQGREIYGDAMHNYVATVEQMPSVPTDSSSTLWGALDAAEAGNPILPHIAGTYRQNGKLKMHRSVKTRLEVKKSDRQPKYKPLAWWYYKRDLGQGVSAKRKYRGPDRWNIDNPNPVKYWEWVD